MKSQTLGYVEAVKRSAKESRNTDANTSAMVDLAKIAELGQAYAQFELIRTLATQAQARFGKHLSLADVERMGEIATLADITIGYIMDAYDAVK